MRAFNKDLKWLNEPVQAAFDNGVLEVCTAEKTDYWRETFYGFRRDNGHFLNETVIGDFSVEVTIRGAYKALYDQAGLMVRLSESHWIKAGVEFTDGKAYVSVVVTNNTSDWSLVDVPQDQRGTRIRMTRNSDAIRVQYLDWRDQNWYPVRLAYFPPTQSAEVGVMCCSPKREGFVAYFEDYALREPISRDLHSSDHDANGQW